MGSELFMSVLVRVTFAPNCLSFVNLISQMNYKLRHVVHNWAVRAIMLCEF